MKRIFILLVAVLFLYPAALSAQSNHHIMAGGAGSEDGSDWSNAWDDLPGTFVRGDTYYICEGAYGPHNFNTAESSTTEIFITKATDSAHGSATGWSNGMCDNPATFTGTAGNGATFNITTKYWDIDGVTGGGFVDGMTSGHGFVIDHTGSNDGIRVDSGSGTSGITLAHIEIDGNDDNASTTGDNIIICCDGDKADNGLIQYVWLHDPVRTNIVTGASASTSGAEGWTLEHSALQFPGSNAGQHSENISLGDGQSVADSWTIRYNLITNPISTGGIIINGTGTKVYGNVFTWEDYQCGASSCNNGIIGHQSSVCVNAGKTCGGHFIYNNTFVDLSNSASKIFPIAAETNGGGATTFKNNILCNLDSYSNGVTTRSHNLFAAMTAPGESNEQDLSGTSCESLFSSYGVEGLEASDDFRLEAATTAGDNTIGAEYNTDAYGNTRGSDGTWDRGAFEYDAGSASPPTIDTFTATPSTITEGACSTLAWTTTNATSASIDNGVGSVSIDGSTEVCPTSNTTYTLTATGPGGTDNTPTVTVTVNACTPVPTIDSFSAIPSSISEGETSTLFWTTTNADSDVSIDNGVGSGLAEDGNQNITPVVSTQYTLTATSSGGCTSMDTTSVIVNVSLPVFNPAPITVFQP